MLFLFNNFNLILPIDIVAMAEHLSLSAPFILRSIDQMIRQEFDFSQLNHWEVDDQTCDDANIDISSFEISCDDENDESITGSGISLAEQIDISIPLEAIWPCLLELAEEGLNLSNEGKRNT